MRRNLSVAITRQLEENARESTMSERFKVREHGDVFERHDTLPEYSAWHDGMWVQLAKVGGGTLGKAYDGNWIYRVAVSPSHTEEGDDFATGTPKTHVNAARELAELLELEG